MLRPITNGKVSGTLTTKCSSGVIGGVLITADGTNDATVVLHADNSDGHIALEVATKNSLWVPGPIHLGSRTLYYSITGTGATAQIYEEDFKTG